MGFPKQDTPRKPKTPRRPRSFLYNCVFGSPLSEAEVRGNGQALVPSSIPQDRTTSGVDPLPTCAERTVFHASEDATEVQRQCDSAKKLASLTASAAHLGEYGC